MSVIHESVEDGGRRARARARRLDEIAVEAMRIVRDEGIESLTTHHLARRLDVAVGALYRYFPSKAALVAELERRALDALGRHLARCLSQSAGAFRGDGAALSRVVLAGRAYGHFTRVHPTEAGLIGQLLADPRTFVAGDEAAALVATTTGLLAEVAALFDEAAATGGLPRGPSMERAVLYWSGLRGVLELAKLRAHLPGFDAAPLADAMTRALLVGFGGDAGAVGRAFAAVRRHEQRNEEEEVEP